MPASSPGRDIVLIQIVVRLSARSSRHSKLRSKHGSASGRPPAKCLKRAKPYVYSDEEVSALLAAALSLPPAGALRRWTYHCLFGLIAVTGMRLSEAIDLKCDDVDLDAGVLTIRLTKFGKSRLVPLHPTTSAALRDYAQRRDTHLPTRRTPHFFVAERGGPLLHQYVHRLFWRLSREIGLRRPGDHAGPRVHDLRHRFAICTLLRWYREGMDVECPRRLNCEPPCRSNIEPGAEADP
jgi:integrase